MRGRADKQTQTSQLIDRSGVVAGSVKKETKHWKMFLVNKVELGIAQDLHLKGVTWGPQQKLGAVGRKTAGAYTER